MASEQEILRQILNDPYRNAEQKEAAQAKLDVLNGVVRERGELDKNARGLELVNAAIARLSTRLEEVEQKLKTVRIVVASGTPGPEAEPTSPEKPPVEPTPQANKSDGRGRPKARYIVEGERGNWGIRDRETGRFVYPVQKKRKEADAICREINAGGIVPAFDKTPIQREAEASVALDKDPDCGTQSIEAQTNSPQVPETGGKMYKPEDVKPAPEVRPDKMENRNALGRVPWYSK